MSYEVGVRAYGSNTGPERHVRPVDVERSRLSWAHSPDMQAVDWMIDKVADNDVTVLIRGESGVGKELVARAIHQRSPRWERPYVKVNCAALPAELLESELFGHEKGAFTGAVATRLGKFEVADNGTLFLDEVGELTAALQAKLLHVVQDSQFTKLGSNRPVNVNTRLIAATNRPLEEMMVRREFREDLFYRLKVIEITVPPLRDRLTEVPHLCRAFVHRYARQYNRPARDLSPEIMAVFQGHDWPGNIRELENAIERAMLLADGTLISTDDLRLGDTGGITSPREGSSIVKIPPTGIPLEDVERLALIEALKMSNWVQKDAAELLAISPRVMNYKIKTLGIDFPRGRRAQTTGQAASQPQDHHAAIA